MLSADSVATSTPRDDDLVTTHDDQGCAGHVLVDPAALELVDERVEPVRLADDALKVVRLLARVRDPAVALRRI